MFVRKNRNRSGSISVQIISKKNGRYKVIKIIGTSKDPQEIEVLYHKAKDEISQLSGQISLFINEKDAYVESFIETLSNSQVRVIGPELVFGKVFNKMGFNKIDNDLFRHLVITRLVYPGSKLKMIDYLQRYKGINLSSDSIYRFLDKLHAELKEQVEQIAFNHTKDILGGKITIVFYDITTLYFEASDEDDLRKTGFSKDGKAQHPQILLGLLVGMNGYPISYEIFEGNTFEGHTFIPFLEHFQKKFNFSKPIVIADAGLLSKDNLIKLKEKGYQFILGARIKNEIEHIKKQILELTLFDGKSAEIKRVDGSRLIISYSVKRAKNDEKNRKRGLNRLEKKLMSGRLTKSHINNRGYNKYLKLSGEISIEIDYERFKKDIKWDGIKGYITNSKLTANQVIENYNNLWQIEKAFRISKTDLKVRPIYHRLRDRIEAHICIAFVAYSVYKELERILYLNKAPFSVKKASELTQTMYELNFVLPESMKNKNIILKMDENQKLLKQIIDKNF